MFYDWLHDKGYTAQTAADLTVIELNQLQLGHIVRQELQADARKAAERSGGNRLIDGAKRDHYQSIRQRLRRQ